MRLEKVVGILEELRLDAVLVANLDYPNRDPNFDYLLRPEGGLFEYSFLVVERDGARLFTTELEKDAAEALGVEVSVYRSLGDVLKYLKRFARLGINASSLSLRLAREIERLGVALVDVSEELERMREVKEADEIEAIKSAVRVTEEALREVLSKPVGEMSESEIAAELVHEIMRRGATLAFYPIVAFDENSALPHYTTGSRDGRPKRVVLIDVGARYRHYCADITRTYLLTRDPEVLEAYGAVLDAQERAIDSIREGVEAGTVDEAARKLLESKYPGCFKHSLGHMIGVRVHEGRRLRSGEKYKLVEGMVFTVEPGVYFTGKFGIRIEDDVVVRKGGAEVLSSLPKSLDDVLLG